MSRAPPGPPGGSSCSIFIGNIPYDANEDELKELFGKVGNVVSVRLVLDKDTKVPKGYAFADFENPASVQAAVDKLNHVEYNGRKLRIDAAERELTGGHMSREEGGKGGKGGGKGGAPPIDPSTLPSVPTVMDRLAEKREKEAVEKAKMAAAELAERAEIGRLLETLMPQQVLHVLGEMQRLTLRAPEVARALVHENAQLALALQHAEFLAGLLEEPPLATEPEVRERARNVREKIWGVSLAPAPAPMPGAPPGIFQVPGAPMMTMPGQQGVTFGTMPGMLPGQSPMQYMPTGYGPPGMMQMGQMGTMGGPMQQQMMYGPAGYPQAGMPAPGPYGQAPSPQGGGPKVDTEEQRRGLLERLSQLSPAEIDKLPHNTKVQLLEFLQKLPAAQRPNQVSA